LELESNGLKYLVGVGVDRAGDFGWCWSQMGWNILLVLVSNELEYLDGAGDKLAGIYEWN
jgi:hypothetical protein